MIRNIEKFDDVCVHVQLDICVFMLACTVFLFSEFMFRS